MNHKGVMQKHNHMTMAKEMNCSSHSCLAANFQLNDKLEKRRDVVLDKLGKSNTEAQEVKQKLETINDHREILDNTIKDQEETIKAQSKIIEDLREKVKKV